MLPFEIFLRLNLTRNQIVMKEPSFDFLCRILTCIKGSNKWHTLSRISKHMIKDIFRTKMNVFFSSQFSCCPLIWMFHNQILKKRINKLQEIELCLLHNDNTSSFYELLQKENSFTIHH